MFREIHFEIIDHVILHFLKNKIVLFGFIYNDEAIIYHQRSPLCT